MLEQRIFGERKMITTYETQTRYIECAKCKRITSEGHAEQFLDIWICCWCGQEVYRKKQGDF